MPQNAARQKTNLHAWGHGTQSVEARVAGWAVCVSGASRSVVAHSSKAHESWATIGIHEANALIDAKACIANLALSAIRIDLALRSHACYTGAVLANITFWAVRIDLALRCDTWNTHAALAHIARCAVGIDLALSTYVAIAVHAHVARTAVAVDDALGCGVGQASSTTTASHIAWTVRVCCA